MLQVKVYCINRNQPGQYFGLKLAEQGNEQVLPYAPNNWKTERGAVNWAKRHGYEVVTERERTTGAKDFDGFVNHCSDAIRRTLNDSEAGRELTKRLLEMKLAENPRMTAEERANTKSEFMTFLFCEMVQETPDLMHEMAGHVYNELRAKQGAGA